MSAPANPSDWLRAFNAGCDARIAGLPLSSDPYGSTAPDLKKAWRHGWRDVHDWWAADVKGRWAVRRLPPVWSGRITA